MISVDCNFDNAVETETIHSRKALMRSPRYSVSSIKSRRKDAPEPTSLLQQTSTSLQSPPTHSRNIFNMRFTYISVFIGLCASLAYSAALNPATISSLAARAPDVENIYDDVVGYELPDGHRKIDFYHNGALAGSVVETDDGGMLSRHAHPQQVSNTLTLNSRVL